MALQSNSFSKYTTMDLAVPPALLVRDNHSTPVTLFLTGICDLFSSQWRSLMSVMLRLAGTKCAIKPKLGCIIVALLDSLMAHRVSFLRRSVSEALLTITCRSPLGRTLAAIATAAALAVPLEIGGAGAF